MGPLSSQTADWSLLKLVEEHDQQALVILYERYGHLVYSIALRILKNPTAAEDLKQEIFLQVWRSPEKITSLTDTLHGWMTIASRNKSISMLRKKQPDSLNDLILVAPGDFQKVSDRRLACDTLICTLAVEQRALLDMHYFQEMTQAEIAAATGCPLGTIKTRIRTALLTLKRSVRIAEVDADNNVCDDCLQAAG